MGEVCLHLFCCCSDPCQQFGSLVVFAVSLTPRVLELNPMASQQAARWSGNSKWYK